VIWLTYTRHSIKIYKNKFWKPQHLKSFSNQSVANIIYDGCVNQGISGIKSVLRKVLLNKGINITDNDNPLIVNLLRR
jgi:lysozyme family protein